MARVLIIETTFSGIPAWHAECEQCPDWRCHKHAHNTNKTAVKCGERHLNQTH
jgi:hypothetical protein